jgi:ABC-2 type transport system permease protein
MVIIGLVTVVALASGMKVLGSPADLLMLYSLAAILNFAGTCWGAGVMFRGRSAQFAPAMQVPFFIAIFLAPVYVPLAFLTGWVATVAQYNPITLLLETGRDLFAGATPPHLAGAYATAVALLVILVTWGVRGLHKAERAG